MFTQTSSLKRRIAGLVAVTVLIAAGAATAIGRVPSHRTTRSRPDLAATPMPAAALTASFSVLRAPIADPSAVPETVRDQLGTDGEVRTYGVDLSTVHIAEPGGHQIYVAPGTRGLCVLLRAGGGVCSGNFAALVHAGLSFSVVPTPSGPISSNGSTIGSGLITTYGLAPDGVTSVEGVTADGRHVPAAMNLGAYVLRSDSPVARLRFHTARATWQTTPGSSGS